MTGPNWFDNHCHLGGDSTEVVARARLAGVAGIVTVGCDLSDSQNALAIASEHPDVWATAGVHPHEARNGVEGLADLMTTDCLVAVGEAGLDFYYDHSPRGAQRKVFAAQVDLANRFELPLVIHTRDAWTETFDILDAEGVPERTVFHCFTGGPDEATAGLERGALLSFSGIITFNSADNVRAAAALCPLNRAMVETDSPYLTPVPYRGKPNEPANVGLVGAALARAKGRSLEEVAATTTTTARVFYGLEGASSVSSD